MVDYTLPSACNENAAFYCSNRLPFVMGTTGGDRDAMAAEVSTKTAAAHLDCLSPSLCVHAHTNLLHTQRIHHFTRTQCTHISHICNARTSCLRWKLAAPML